MATYTGTPSTATAGGTITAANWNADVRDVVNALSGAWNSYTPTLGGFTAGNGTAAGAYIRMGKLVMFRAKFSFGSTSAAASTFPTLTLPVTAVTGGYGALHCIFNDTGVAYYIAGAVLSSTTVATMGIIGASGVLTACSTTTPINPWNEGDEIFLNGVYEAA